MAIRAPDGANKVWAKWARTKVKNWEIQVSNFHALNYCCKLCRKTSTLMKLDESSIQLRKYIIPVFKDQDNALYMEEGSQQ